MILLSNMLNQSNSYAFLYCYNRRMDCPISIRIQHSVDLGLSGSEKKLILLWKRHVDVCTSSFENIYIKRCRRRVIARLSSVLYDRSYVFEFVILMNRYNMKCRSKLSSSLWIGMDLAAKQSLFPCSFRGCKAQTPHVNLYVIVANLQDFHWTLVFLFTTDTNYCQGYL